MDLGGSHISMRSNKTIIGLPGAAITNGGFEFYKDSNVIIRNVTFDNGNIDDALKINQETHHIWIDHVTMSNYEDGLLDITRGSNYITVSWSHFKNHDKVMLIGHVDNEPLDKGALKVSVHHNWFDGTHQRHPRVRQGWVHVYNNYFSKLEIYGIVSANNAQVLVENNYFQDVANSMQSGVEGFSGPGFFVERGNQFDNSGKGLNVGSVFEAKSFYDYSLDPATAVPEIVKNGAGAGKIDAQEAIAAAK